MNFSETQRLFINIIFLISLIKYVVLQCEVKYSGRTYVQEGQPFTITCHRSPYSSIPKWTKDGISVVPDENNNYTQSSEELKEENLIVMKLHVDVAERKHKGKYKCDSSCSKSHRIDVVPLKETDEERTGVSILLTVNETLELYCADIDNSIFPINWYKDKRRILETDDIRISMEGRKLMISDATRDDAGDYFCTVEVSGPGLSHPVADHLGYVIQVTYAASVEPFPSQIRPILSRNLTLECKVHGYPVPRVTWFIDNVASEEFKLNNSRVDTMDNSEGLPNSVFFINNVTYDDVHVLTCYAENVRGFTETSVLLVVRENMISTNEDYPGKGIILSPGSELFLQCNTTDNPLLNVRWFKDGHAINMTDTRIHIDQQNNTMVINQTTEADTGSYMCDVEGSEEVINATIIVRTKVKLWPFENSRNVVQGQNINLRCNVSQGVPLPTLQWLKDGEPLNISDSRISIEADDKGIADSILTIKDSDFDDRAEYMCVATNEVNSVNETILVRVKDKYAALWPFLGICAEVAVLCTIIFIYEKKRQKPDFDESDAEHNTENKAVPDKEEKSQDVRQRK